MKWNVFKTMPATRIAVKVIDGWPCISENLQWAEECPLYLMGQFTALQVDLHLHSINRYQLHPFNLNFCLTDWSSCSKPGWWTSYKHANRKGYQRSPGQGWTQGFWAERREVQNWGICSTDEGSVVALIVVNESTLKVRHIGEACFIHFIYSM